MISLSTSFRQLGLPEQFSLGAVLVLENDQSVGFQVKLVQKCEQNSFPDDPCMVYLPTKLGHLWGFYVGIHIPAPWSIWDWDFPQLGLFRFAGLAGLEALVLRGEG